VLSQEVWRTHTRERMGALEHRSPADVSDRFPLNIYEIIKDMQRLCTFHYCVNEMISKYVAKS
jgi:hypothetical protein